ncbi:MAG: Calx-beta domain-containing protein [Pseudomonadota bacterium]
MPRQQTLDVIAHVGDALKHAHGVGVTHADVKPGNVMMLDDGTVKLLDFGIARARGDAGSDAPEGDNSFLQAATPAFASPAVLKGSPARPIDDVFSLACLAYRLLGGRRVFRDRTALDALEQGNKPPRIPNLETRLWRALERALALDEAERTESVEAFLQDLGVRQDAMRRPRWLFYAGVAAALTGLAIVAVMSPRWRNTDPMEAAVVVPEAIPTGAPTIEDNVIEPIPIPQFLVTSAQYVNSEAQSSSAALILPFEDDVVAPVIRLVEDSGLATVSLHMPQVDAPVSLRLRRSSVSESMRRVLGEHVRIATPQPFVFSAEQNRVSIGIENLSDSVVEPDATVTYDIVRLDTSQVVGNFALRLIDDDRARVLSELPVDTVSFAQDNVEVSEDTGATTLTLWRLNSSGEALDVTLSVIGMSAVDDEDFVSPVPPVVRFEPDQTVATVFIPIVSDAEAEDVELFRVTLNDAASPEDINRIVTVRILDTL